MHSFCFHSFCFVLYCCISCATLCDANTLSERIRTILPLPAQERIALLEELCTLPQYVDQKPAIQHLITDARYEQLKSQQALALFELAQSRFDGAPEAENGVFSRYAALQDALSISQGIRIEWLPSKERERFLEWYSALQSELNALTEGVSPGQETPLKESDPNDDIDFIATATKMINDSLETAENEDLHLLKNAEPKKRGKFSWTLKGRSSQSGGGKTQCIFLIQP